MNVFNWSSLCLAFGSIELADKKKPPEGGFLPKAPLVGVLDQTRSDGLVASSHDTTAGLAQDVFGHAHTVAGSA